MAAFCFNRGQLTKVLDSNSFAAFAVALLLPVNIEFEEKPIASSKKTDSDDSASKKQTVFEDVEYCLVTFKGMALLKEIGMVITRFCIKVNDLLFNSDCVFVLDSCVLRVCIDCEKNRGFYICSISCTFMVSVFLFSNITRREFVVWTSYFEHQDFIEFRRSLFGNFCFRFLGEAMELDYATSSQRQLLSSCS